MTAQPDEDPFTRPLQPPFTQALMRLFMAMPNILDAQLEGADGPVDVPPEQLGEVLQNAMWLILRTLPEALGQVDVLKHRVATLEARIAQLEGSE